ncbi:tetratricopeptide repeat-containing sensor histidine kinase [Maribacter sp. ACAM166]|uniref:tetratricopeptide repeat-containing sensor histidine kinase n=1 Tax=Maribacter sp. ACAM166 TaxID=2508996 RepID=UPI0010FF0991|nr:tetratricopeptide repeat-containing sensor histidine kinase [Maribacter sp. ACAM166]TLP81306.1 tetratricopeptide repeat protein [Maribacter sp. ACAM166]
MIKRYLVLLILLKLLSSCSETELTQEAPLKAIETDSISFWIEESKNPESTEQQNLTLLKKAHQFALNTSSDSLQANYFSVLSENLNFTTDSTLFREINKQAISLNQKRNDSLPIGFAYWDLALFFEKYSVKDSVYYSYSEAQKVFETIEEKQLSGRMFLQMARIQISIKDNVGSQATTTRAIENFKLLNDNRYLSESYNNLGIASGILGEVEKSLSYYNEALYYLKQEEPYNYIKEAKIVNNIGVVYQQNNLYEKAIDNYDKVLNIDNLIEKNPVLYALALSNLASSKLYLKDTLDVNNLFIKAIEIKDKENQIASLASSYFNYAKYKAYANDTLMAISFIQKAEDLSIESENNERLLEVWGFLSELKKNDASNYFKKYIKLDDSLQKEERKQQNKFARIRFETDEFIAENVELESEKESLSKQKTIWTGIATGLFLLGLFIYTIINQRAKNQKLRFDQQQQANNQEIFNLMLMQKQKVDEVKRMEQKRISEELHDGILGKILGARMVLTGLNKRATEEAIQEKAKALGSLQEIEKEIRSISHELSHSAYQKINNFTDSIESLLLSANKNANIHTIFNFNEDESWDSLAGDIKINTYRIIQESFQNAIKHANCTIFDITFHRTDEQFDVIMNDNGIGFNDNKGKKGIGIRNITSRVNKLKGTCNIDSIEGQGTTITLKIPIIKKSNNSTDNNSYYKNV